MTCRTLTLSDGTELHQHWRGDPTLRDSENPQNWETVALDQHGKVFTIRNESDFTVGVSPQGNVLFGMGRLLVEVPLEAMADVLALLPEAVREAKKAKRG